MEQKTFKIEGYDYEFRPKKINAIEMLAFQTQMGLENMDQATKVFNTILEYIEVNAEGKWLPVKTKGMDLFFPMEIETNYDLVKNLVKYFSDNILKPVFRSSNESKT